MVQLNLERNVNVRQIDAEDNECELMKMKMRIGTDLTRCEDATQRSPGPTHSGTVSVYVPFLIPDVGSAKCSKTGEVTFVDMAGDLSLCRYTACQ